MKTKTLPLVKPFASKIWEAKLRLQKMYTWYGKMNWLQKIFVHVYFFTNKNPFRERDFNDLDIYQEANELLLDQNGQINASKETVSGYDENGIRQSTELYFFVKKGSNRLSFIEK